MGYLIGAASMLAVIVGLVIWGSIYLEDVK